MLEQQEIKRYQWRERMTKGHRQNADYIVMNETESMC